MLLSFVLYCAVGWVVACAVSIVGIVFVDGGRMTLERDPGQSMVESRAPVLTGPAFTPLDLGQAVMLWPSEMPRERTRLAELPWPSETWEGDFFQRKGNMALSAAPTPTLGGMEDRWMTGEGAQTLETEPSPRAAPAPAPAPAPRPTAPPPKVTKTEKKPASSAQRPPPRQGGIAGLTDDQLVRIVESQGLAQAVEIVRGKTGWDFQKAAQHIAGVLRARREGRS